MLNLFLILVVIAGGSAVSRHFPTEDLLQDQFALGQNYYAANDHGNAVIVFEQIESTPNYALLNVDGIMVTIGEVTLPLRQAATYQLGNSYRNVGRSQLERSEAAAAEGDTVTSQVRRREAREAFVPHAGATQIEGPQAGHLLEVHQPCIRDPGVGQVKLLQPGQVL